MNLQEKQISLEICFICNAIGFFSSNHTSKFIHFLFENIKQSKILNKKLWSVDILWENWYHSIRSLWNIDFWISTWTLWSHKIHGKINTLNNNSLYRNYAPSREKKKYEPSTPIEWASYWLIILKNSWLNYAVLDLHIYSPKPRP